MLITGFFLGLNTIDFVTSLGTLFYTVSGILEIFLIIQASINTMNEVKYNI